MNNFAITSIPKNYECQGVHIYHSADELPKKISDTPYDILSNNCATAVAKSLNKAGIITYMGNNNPIWTIKLNSYIPSRLFNDIVKHNSNGKYIYK